MIKIGRMKISLLLTVLLGGGLFFYQHKSAVPAHLVTSSVPPLEGVSQYLKGARDYQSSLKAMSDESSAEFTKECVDYFSSLEQFNLLDSSNGEGKLTYQLLPKRPDDCTWKDSFMDRMEADFASNCRPVQDQSAVISEECGEKLFFMRAGITRLLLKNKPMSEIKDIHQLVDLLFSEFATSGPGETPDFSRIKAAADRMLELNPSLYVAAKTSAYAGAIEGLSAAKNGNLTGNAQEVIWKKAELDLKHAEDLKPNDPSLDDAKVAIATRGFDPDKTLEYGNQSISQHSNDGRGYFLRSYAEWKMNLRDDSVRDLIRAIELNPQETGYVKTLSEIQKPGATVETFQGQFKFMLNSDDFKE